MVARLKKVAPHVTRVAVIFNPDTAPFATSFNHSIEVAAPSFGVTVTLAPVHDDTEIDEVATVLAREPGGGLISLPESFSVTHRDVIAAADPTWLAADLHRPYPQGRQSGRPAGSAADEMALIVNLKPAKVLGLTVPQSILALADEVIE